VIRRYTRQHQHFVGNQRIGGGGRSEVALDDAGLVVGQGLRGVFPQGDVGGHVDFSCAHQWLAQAIPGTSARPIRILNGTVGLEIGAAVDHLLGVNIDARGGAFQLVEAFLDVSLIESGLWRGQRRRVSQLGKRARALSDGGCALLRRVVRPPAMALV